MNFKNKLFSALKLNVYRKRGIITMRYREIDISECKIIDIFYVDKKERLVKITEDGRKEIEDGRKEIFIPNGIKSIGCYAFAGEKIESIRIPEGVIRIEKFAFSQCFNLKRVMLPETLVYLDSYSFNCCLNLESLELPKNLKYIGDYAFFKAWQVNDWENFNLPDKVESIGVNAFALNRIKKIKIPKGLRHLGFNAFGIVTLEEVILEDSLEDFFIQMFVTEQCWYKKKVKFKVKNKD